MTGDALAGRYAQAAWKMLERHSSECPAQPATRAKAVRFLRLAIAHLED